MTESKNTPNAKDKDIYWLKENSFNYDGTYWSKPGIRLYKYTNFWVAVTSDKTIEFADDGNTPEEAVTKSLRLKNKFITNQKEPQTNKDSKDTLGDRMKRYEAEAFSHDGEITQNPVVIRLDGNAFHTWTRKAGLEKPFDERLVDIMRGTMLFLCEHVQGCVFGYTQSDEISLCLRNDMSEKTEPWFENRIQKLCSVSASMAGAVFNRLAATGLSGAPLKISMEGILPEQLEELRRELEEEMAKPHDYVALPLGTRPRDIPPAFFDSRVMFMPDLEEVVNCFIWRQNDCIKNSVSSLAQAHFRERELKGKKREELKEMLKGRGIDWEALPAHLRLGSVCRKTETVGEYKGAAFTRRKFVMDSNPPKFSEDKDYLRKAYYI